VGSLNPYSIEFDSRAIRDGALLPLPIRRRIRAQLEFLRAAPHRSHPGVQVKEIAEMRGVWRFHATTEVRVFYSVVGERLWVIMIARSPGVSDATIRELRKRMVRPT
jgi:mRNA-degrading endonuclease RelE of RelBE toxin-antitoxin system